MLPEWDNLGGFVTDWEAGFLVRAGADGLGGSAGVFRVRNNASAAEVGAFCGTCGTTEPVP